MQGDLVFIGGGRITTALLSGLRQSKFRGSILVHDRNPHKLDKLQRDFRIKTAPDLKDAVKRAGLLIVAVRPQNLPDAIASLPAITRPLPALSLAAGMPLAVLRKLAGPPVHWARAMPSPTARNRQGLTALTIPRGYPAQARRAIEHLFTSVGEIIHIPDRQMDAWTVTYSSTQGLYALQALASAGQRLGLSRRVALVAAFHALGHSIAAWRDGDVPLAELLHEAATPGGIAAECMAALDSGGYPKLVERALRAGVNRARQFATALRPR